MVVDRNNYYIRNITYLVSTYILPSFYLLAEIYYDRTRSSQPFVVEKKRYLHQRIRPLVAIEHFVLLLLQHILLLWDYIIITTALSAHYCLLASTVLINFNNVSQGKNRFTL